MYISIINKFDANLNKAVFSYVIVMQVMLKW